MKNYSQLYLKNWYQKQELSEAEYQSKIGKAALLFLIFLFGILLFA